MELALADEKISVDSFANTYGGHCYQYTAYRTLS